MADIAVTAALVGLVDPLNATVKSYIAGATITKGQAVSLYTDGTVDPSDASSGQGYLYENCVGIALNGGGAGQAIDVVRKGEVYGFTVSGQDSGDVVKYAPFPAVPEPSTLVLLTIGAVALLACTRRKRCWR